MSILLDHALEYEKLGFSVVPVKPGNKAPTLVKWEPYQKERATPEQIKEWWHKNPSANIGIVTGKISGICVVDFDKYKPDYQQDLTDKYFSDSILTPTAKSPSGGEHLYFKYPDNIETLSGNAGKLPAIDLRADGNYIVAPPSQNGNGKRYQWMDGLTFKDFQSLSFLPDLYLLYVLKNNSSYVLGNTTSVVNETTQGNINYNILQDGRRGADLFKIGMSLGDGRCPRWMIEQILEKLALSSNPPYSENELKPTIKSIMDRLTRKERNLAEEVREFFLLQKGYTNTTEIQQTLQITTKEEKKNLTVILNRLQGEGLIEKYGEKRGCYRPIEKTETKMKFIEEDVYEYPVKLPFGLNDMCSLFPQNITMVAGSKSAGKTAFLLNLALANQDRHEIVYLNSEMGDGEYTNRMKALGCKKESDVKFTMHEVHGNFHDYIDGSKKIWIIDYLEIHDKFFEIAAPIRQIHEKLKDGICFIGLQKKGSEKLGRGAEFSMEKARLYLSLDYIEDTEGCTKLTIVDAKAPKMSTGCRGLSKRIKILGGSSMLALDKEWLRIK
jgi:hypothetical protein